MVTLKNKVRQYAPSIATACLCMGTMLCHADATSEIFEMVFSLLKIAFIAIGIMMAIAGVVNYTTADDDGPQKKKGATMIGSAIALIALGAAIAGFGSKLASALTS